MRSWGELFVMSWYFWGRRGSNNIFDFAITLPPVAGWLEAIVEGGIWFSMNGRFDERVAF